MLETQCLHIHSSEDVAILSTQLSKILSDKTGTTYNNYSVQMNYHPYDDTDIYWWKQFEERYTLIIEYWKKKDKCNYLICNVSSKRDNDSKVRIRNFVKMPGL